VHSLSLERESDVTILVASGELDAFVEDDLVGVFNESGRDGRIVVDLTHVSFLDSTALGILVRAVREVGERGGEIRVVLPHGTARRIFEITTLDRVLPVADSRTDAFAALDGGALDG
jgi:anti-sigma B factor antagonist